MTAMDTLSTIQPVRTAKQGLGILDQISRIVKAVFYMYSCMFVIVGLKRRIIIPVSDLHT